ncbi:MAG: adenylosuccinate synthase [Bacteroidales bacterium]
MHVDVLIGLQWGDEGKGKIVDVFTPHYDVIARFQGGPNAGHTLEFQGSKHVLHHIPSGIFREETINLIGNGVIIDPMSFQGEIAQLNAKGINTTKNLYLSNKAHLILPTHRLLDLAIERQKGKQKIGSTLKGIGPTYTDKAARQGLRIGDLLQPNFMDRYQTLKDRHLALLKSYGLNISNETIDDKSFEQYEAAWLEATQQIAKMRIVDSEHFINQQLDKGKKVLAEGAQGTLLDIDFGSYPFVTSSNTITAGVCAGLGVAPKRINRVFGVFKAYCTRVGSGPFPTELDDSCGKKLRDQGNEFGSTTGRPRRCGWLDIPALNYAIMLNGVTDLVMTKADVLKDFTQINVCEAYSINQKKVDFSIFNLENPNLECILHDLPGWTENIQNLSEINQLPTAMQEYVHFIEEKTKTPITVISTSADRTGIIFKNQQMFH